jgi:membrane protease YdiL (CAAX protease family)
VYLPGGIDQVIPLPLVFWQYWSAGMLPAIAIAFAATGDRDHKARYPPRPAPAFIKMLGITIAIIVVALGYCVFEFIYHGSDADFGPGAWQLWWIFLEMEIGWTALVVYTIARPKHPVLVIVPAATVEIVQGPTRIRGWSAVLILAMSCTLISELVSIAANLGKGFNFQLQPIERLMYYVFSGVAEESLFRVALMTPILAVFYISKTTRKSKIPAIIASIVSGIVWSLMHWPVYGPGGTVENVTMLYVLAINGFVYGMFFALTRNPLYPIVAHMLVNLFASLFSFTMAIGVLI